MEDLSNIEGLANTPQVTAPVNNTPPAPQPENQSQTGQPQSPPQPKGFDFVPERYKSASWVSKYQDPDKFWDGIENAQKMLGQKQVVQGIEVPADDAPSDKWAEFHSKIGRPEAPDKYELPDVELDDLDKEGTAKLFHEVGMPKKMAQNLLVKFAQYTKERNGQVEQKEAQSFQETLKSIFPDNPKKGYDLAKRGVKNLGLQDKITNEDSKNPVLLQALAKLGELTGEDSIFKGGGESKEGLMEEAKRIQGTPEYWKNQEVFDKVADLYKKAGAGKK